MFLLTNLLTFARSTLYFLINWQIAPYLALKGVNFPFSLPASLKIHP